MEGEYGEHLPVSFFEDVAVPWFRAIFPVKSEMYGVEGLQRLGPLHAVAEFAGCYYRWQRMVDLEYTLSSDAMTNAVHDAFGYAVIMRTMSEADITWTTAVKPKAPRRDLDTLIGFYWDDQMPVDKGAVTMATRCSLNMYRGTPGA